MKRLIAIALFLGLGLLRASADPVVAKAPDSVIYPRGTAGAEDTGHAGASSSYYTLVVGVMLAAGGGWLLWTKKRQATLGTSAGKLKISETRSLGSKQYLVVASYGDQKFLLGVCPGKIDLLAPLEGPGAKLS